MDTGAAIAATLCVVTILIPLGLLFTALVLRAAVSVFNRFAGSPGKPPPVPLPTLATGMLISFLASIVNATVYGVAASGTGAIAIDGLHPEMSLTVWLISSPISLLVLAALLTFLLPTTFARALLITLGYVVFAVVLIIGLSIVVAFIVALIVAVAASSR